MHKITINLPLPRRGRALCERGRGDRGQKSKLKAGQAGGKESTPPAGHHSSKVSRQGRGKPPTAHVARPCPSAAQVQTGVPGAEPLA